MNNFFYFIIITVILNASSQLLLKKGMNSIGLFDLSFSSILKNIENVLFNPYILSGLILMTFSMITHLISLSKFDVSFAFPFISLSYIIVFLGGYFLFNEQISIMRLVGFLFIIIGTIFLAKS